MPNQWEWVEVKYQEIKDGDGFCEIKHKRDVERGALSLLIKTGKGRSWLSSEHVLKCLRSPFLPNDGAGHLFSPWAEKALLEGKTLKVDCYRPIKLNPVSKIIIFADSENQSAFFVENDLIRTWRIVPAETPEPSYEELGKQIVLLKEALEKERRRADDNFNQFLKAIDDPNAKYEEINND